MPGPGELCYQKRTVTALNKTPFHRALQHTQAFSKAKRKPQEDPENNLVDPVLFLPGKEKVSLQTGNCSPRGSAGNPRRPNPQDSPQEEIRRTAKCQHTWPGRLPGKHFPNYPRKGKEEEAQITANPSQRQMADLTIFCASSSRRQNVCVGIMDVGVWVLSSFFLKNPMCAQPRRDRTAQRYFVKFAIALPHRDRKSVV